MQTSLTQDILNTPEGQEADSILRACVHCGFCTATCPTYQLLGDELDSPRGRIYIIKQMLEGQEVSQESQLHLDRCLTCQSCETTCPSGVRYGSLVNIGRELIDQRVKRPLTQRLYRKLICAVIPYRKRFTPLLRLGQSMGFLLPPSLKQKVPARQNPVAAHSRQHQRKILLLEGCVQPALSPDINSATIRLLDKLGIEAIVQADEKCCGGLHLHTDSMHSAREFMRNNIDQWWPHVENGIEAIISTASGCGVTIKDYGHLLKDDSAYADKAQKISSLTRDISEFIAEQDLNSIKVSKQYDAVAFHPPCTLQHGQKITGVIENILKQCGYQLTPVENSHLCCGSAGSYSLLQPTLSEQLGQQKIQTLEHGGPEIIATANIGCQVHLQAKTRLPVVHWITLIS